MKNKLMLVLLVLILTACGPPATSEGSGSLVVPEGLKDCKFYFLDPGGIKVPLRVIRCPNSTTSTAYKVGKNPPTNIVVIDGKEYVEKTQ